MIFQHTGQKVLTEDKWLTSRLCQFDERGFLLPCRYKAGKTYAVQPGRGKAAVGRILIKKIEYREQAKTISEPEALAEGFDSVTAYYSAFEKAHGKAALLQPVWRIWFNLVRFDSGV
jgi:hypothetical protein